MSEKQCRSKKEKKPPGRPAAKAILKPASTSNPNFIPMKDTRWIDIEVQKIKGPILLPDVEVSLLIWFDREKLVGKKMLMFLEMQRKTVKGFMILAKRSKTRIEDGTALVSAKVDGCSGKRWWSKEKVSILFETK